MEKIDIVCVLVVDDNEAVLTALTTLMQALGYRVLTAASPMEAVSKARTEDIDVVLADATLAPTSGAVLLDSIRARFPHIATVLMSGYRPDDLDRMGIRVGVHEFVGKPFRSFEIVESINNAIETVRTTSAPT